MEYLISNSQIEDFAKYLKDNEKESGTIAKYCRDVRNFSAWINGREVTKELVIAWKEHLSAEGYAPVTINSMVVAVNQFLRFLGWEQFRIKTLRIQRRLFRNTEKELTKAEYIRLLDAAQSMGRERLALLMETICATGIRVSEVRYITVEAICSGRAEVNLKGKIRTIIIPTKLCRKLIKYAKKQKIVSGEVFLTRNGKGMSRRQIWAEMKNLCDKAGVAASKVFPHNLRHLFARVFYRTCRDIVRLADVLGHSSVETTRIYLLSTGLEHARMLDRMGLII